jgi:hypothetical protein
MGASWASMSILFSVLPQSAFPMNVEVYESLPRLQVDTKPWSIQVSAPTSWDTSV